LLSVLPFSCVSLTRKSMKAEPDFVDGGVAKLEVLIPIYI
jgi:hypothetical protein